MEPLISGRAACVLLGRLKGVKALSNKTLIRLAKFQGLPAHPDPFGGEHWVYLRSEIEAWYSERIQIPLAPVGRPRKQRAPESRQVPGGSLTAR